ncbi:hypothetical protein ACEWY4_005787 [Coilia grayii]|uniref:C2H2-type domain-containing protein n=1 Tax=Coilia grayii TaxID=363190 RepID=A0ABD1KJG4_9TELE
MGKEKKCILCEIVCSSKQDMDEHMRSMLHHRELENLKGRDCGHECRACGVKVMALTDYADHISSPVHKQRVEALEQQSRASDQEEEYFDKGLVQLIEKRKEQIRIQEAAAKKEREEEERRKQQQQQMRYGTKPWLRQNRASWDWSLPGVPPPPKLWWGDMSSWQKAPGGGNADRGDWNANNHHHHHQSRLNKSATWHAEVPPNFQNWSRADCSGGNQHGSRQNDFRGHLEYLGGKNWGGRYESNSRDNPALWQPSKQPSETAQQPDCSRDLSNKFPKSFSQSKSTQPSGKNNQKCARGQDLPKKGYQSRESSSGERDRNKGPGTQKVDKQYRWAPYPSSKVNDLPPSVDGQNDPGPSSVLPESHLQSGQHSRRLSSEHHHGDQDYRKSRQSSSQSGGSTSSESPGTHLAWNSKKTERPTEQKERALLPSPYRSDLSRASSQDSVNLRMSRHPESGASRFTSRNTASTAEEERLLSAMLRRAKETLLDKRPPANPCSSKEQSTTEPPLHIEEPNECASSSSRSTTADHNHRKNASSLVELFVSEKDPSSDRSSLGTRYASSQTESPFLQSVQVSTSTAEQEDEVDVKDEEKEAPALALHGVDEGFGSDGNTPRGDVNAQATCDGAATVPSQSKPALPTCLKRDLGRHITTKGKVAPGHEPNLNNARRIRNVNGARKPESEKDSALKPILRDLISSTGSRRNVNWDQVYQEVSRKKQEKGKGLPRFGIEMVSREQENATQAEGEEPLCEGYHWDSLLDPSTLTPPSSRKRSLSESSLAPDRPPTNLSLFSPPPDNVRDTARPSCSQSDPRPKDIPGQNFTELPQGLPQVSEESPGAQARESVDGDSSCISGAEMNESHSGGKKRRAAGEVPTAEIACAERKNKRRKLKCKKERSHVDQLLAVSLKEEELNGSLLAVDQSLIQARAALQAAYMEVQRLLVVKQQVTMEMSTLRSRRIEILKGMQDDLHTSTPRRASTEEAPETVATAVASMATAASSLFSLLPETPAFGQGQPVCPRRAAPPSPLSPAQPTPTTTLQPSVVIKTEPLSPPSSVPEEPEPAQSPAPHLHSTTPELPALTTTYSGLDVESAPPVEMVELRQSTTDLSPAPMLETSAASSRRSSRILETAPPQPPPPPLLLPEAPTVCSSEQAKAVKKVRKLKKKRMLRQAQGSSPQADDSDTESEGESAASRTLMRKLRPRRRASGSQVSTSSTAPSADKLQEEKEEEEEEKNNSNSDGGVKGESAEVLDAGRISPPPSATLLKLKDSDSSEVEVVELHQAKAEEVISIDISDPEDVNMEEEATKMDSQCQSDPVVPEDCVKKELPKVACNEVTSTSEMPKASIAVKTDENSSALTGKLSKSSADAACEAGEEQKLEPTEGMFEGHQEAVHDMQIHDGLLYTCSGDRTVRGFCLSTHQCVSVFEGHTSKVNCILLSSGQGLAPRLYSGSSDQTVRCYSLRTRECVEQLSLPDRVLCLHSRWKVLFVGLANGSVVTFSLKTNRQLEVFDCHGPRAVSCLATAQEGVRRILLVGSYDSTISVRDAKNGLLLRTLEGHSKTVLCMKVVNDLVFSGSSDQSVHAHNIHTGELVRIYKGHSHAVTVVAILGKVMVTACLDKLVRVYELQSHDRLQVYGGHSDMVMCMVIHKSMIYTGCYDGSVRAVKLNLIQNYRCLWHGCSLIFGVMEHLQQHVLQEHASPGLQTLKCRWKSCDAFFSARNGSKQGLEKHMLKHAEEDSKMEP